MKDNVFGVKGQFSEVCADDTGRIYRQTFRSERRQLGNDYIVCNIRYDDSCRNGHPTFSITADIYNSIGRDIGGGCCHDDICKAFPEFAGLIKWHLVSADGPMHYLANTLFLAGHYDCWGKPRSKQRELDAARRAACWPDASDRQLKQPRAKLERALLARLPGLLAEFFGIVTACGFELQRPAAACVA